MKLMNIAGLLSCLSVVSIHPMAALLRQRNVQPQTRFYKKPHFVRFYNGGHPELSQQDKIRMTIQKLQERIDKLEKNESILFHNFEALAAVVHLDHDDTFIPEHNMRYRNNSTNNTQEKK